MELDRKHLRLPVESRVFIELDASVDAVEGESSVAICKTLDVSAQGMRVLLDHELQEDAYLQVGVEPPQAEGTSEATFFLVAQVRWCRPADQDEGSFLAGLALMQSEGSDIDHWVNLISTLQD